MTQLQDLQFPIDQQIFAEVLACLPPDWTRATLEVWKPTSSAPGSSLAIKIDGGGQPGIALVSDALQDRVRALFLLNERFKTGLRRILYAYVQRPDGRWSFTGDYDYG